ncbi:MAG: Lrp/AsnC ligand binding domain-containing protein [Promethearchaeota archaeon]
MSTENNVVAFVLLLTDSEKTEEIYNFLKDMDNVKEINMIYGDYDLILRVELPNLAEMTVFMMDLRKKFAIRKSSTLITLAK